MDINTAVQEAMARHRAGDLQGAMALYTKLLAKNRKDIDLHMHAALAALDMGDNKTVRNLASKALKLEPSVSFAHNLLAIVEERAGHLKQALRHLEKAISLQPGEAQYRLNLARLLNALNKPTAALGHLEAALQSEPRNPTALFALSVTQKGLGQMQQAEKNVRALLDAVPLHGDAWKSLATMTKENEASDIERMTAAARALEDRPLEQAKVLFALFAALDKEDKTDQAFSCLAEANALVGAAQAYDVRQDEDLMAEIAKRLTPAMFDRFEPPNLMENGPIFIVGMPRSGTSLVEQICAGHGQVEGHGELPFLGTHVANAMGKNGKPFPWAADEWTKNHIRKIRNGYLDDMKFLGAEAPRGTDKMPGNFLYLGVIKLAFPEARIVHCRRDPVDTCLGLFRRMFHSGHPYAYDQHALVRYYKAYSGLMAHWHSVMGDMILDVQYEKLVADPQGQGKRIFDFCGLDWDPRCLDVANTRRGVLTASSAQVRDGIHQKYLERWRRYEEHIQPLIEGLRGFS